MRDMPLLPQPRDVVPVHKASDQLEATIIRDLLCQAGIDAMIRSRLVPGYEIPVPPGFWGEVLVRPEDEEAATRLIAEYLDALRASPQEPPSS
jgi:hypothetical protein